MPKKLPKPSPGAQIKEKKSTLVKVRLEASLFWKFRRCANLAGIGMSKFIRHAIEAEMNRLNQLSDAEK